MNHRIAGGLLVAMIVAALGGCVPPPKSSVSWSGGYAPVSDSRAETSGVSGVRHAEIIPRKCALANYQNPPDLPPAGCANDLNLQRMVERPSDLLRGREMGPPRAAPVAAAARERLENTRQQANERRVRLEEESREQMQQFAPTGNMR